MSTIHIFLQGKGGVGKSFCASMLGQYKIHLGQMPLCIDTDPVNATLSSYGALGAKRIDIMQGTKIDSQKFDQIFEMIEEAPRNSSVIIDNGASSFVSFSDYILTQNIPEFLHEMGHTVFVNTIITGGDALTDTVNGFNSLVNQLNTDVSLIVWLNPFFGPIVWEGKGFEDFKVYQEHKDKVYGLLSLPEFSPDTFGKDLLTVLKARQTFTEALVADPPYNLMARQRITMMQRAMFGMLATLPEV